MRIRTEILFLCLSFMFCTYGCGGAKTKPDKSLQDNSSKTQTPVNEFVVNKTTKAEVIKKLGKPSGVAINEKGEETLTYNKSHITGKAFIPFYFGSDKYRIKISTYTFDKNGILIKTSKSEQHY